MKGSLKERGDSYLITVSLGRDPEQPGKYKRYFETVKTTSKPVAEKRLREVLTELDKGIFTKPSKLTLSEYLKQWIDDYCWPNLSPRSAEGYEYIIQKYINPKLGQIGLKDLRPDHLQKLYTALLKQGLSNRTVRYCHVTLHKALRSALKQGMIARNVSDATDPPKVQRKEMTFLDEIAAKKFIESVKESPYFSMIYLFLTSGLRRSELLALRWCDIDLEAGRLSVTRTIHQLRYNSHKGEIIFKEPKSAKSRRNIPLPSSTVQVMKNEYQAQIATKKALGMEVKPDDLIFCHLVDSSPILPDGVTHAFHRIAQQAGLKDVHLHTMRHSYASLLLKQGVHLRVIQECLGHASIQITSDIYSHVAPGMQEAAIQKFDNLLTNNKALLPA